MPPLTKQKKNWGKANKAALAKLVYNRDIDITNLSSHNVDKINREHFSHCDKRFFCRNFRYLQP